MKRVICLLALLALAGTRAFAATTLFDFESDGSVQCFACTDQTTLQRSADYATSGKSSALFVTPPWKKGLKEWPHCEAVPLPVTDWRPYDRLVIDIVNPTSDRPFFGMFLSDSKIALLNGFEYRFSLRTKGIDRYVIPLSQVAERVNLADMHIMHFFANHPAAGLRIYLDNIALLKKGEEPPPYPPRLVRQMADLFLSDIGSYDDIARACREAWASVGDVGNPHTPAARELAKTLRRLAKLNAQLHDRALTMKTFDSLQHEITLFEEICKRNVECWRLKTACTAFGMPTDKVLVGFATSMDKVLPQEMSFSLTASKTVDISLARNEKESFQVGVIPTSSRLTNVSVHATNLTSESGAVFPAQNIHCSVVGYVKTQRRPPYGSRYVGWWPDPILGFLDHADITKGDVQTFWVRVRADKEQLPGVYHGTLTVSANGVKPILFDLSVHVRTFALPDHAPLATAISFSDGKTGMRNKLMCSKHNWSVMKYVYADFLADYYINCDSIYRGGGPDYEVVQHLHDKDDLVCFNLGNPFREVFRTKKTDKDFDDAIEPAIQSLRPTYEKAQELGLAANAYVYGFDELGEAFFARVEKAALALKKAYPDTLLLTTCRDHSFGVDSVIKSIDAWCPDVRYYDLEKIAKARAIGKQVWWYIFCGVEPPYPNNFVESDAIEIRLLMGAMTSKYRPDGFLYYSINEWSHKMPIDNGPFTSWDPVSAGNRHGDGEWICVDAEGRPIPTIRLENYRDGLEDYAYTCILEEIVRRCKSDQGNLTPTRTQWLTEAEDALNVPSSLVQSLTEYSRDPSQLYAYRDRVADLIEKSGVTDADPWGKDFGVH